MGFEQELRDYLEGVQAGDVGSSRGDEPVARYAAETYLARREGSALRVSPLGEAFLRLRGRDAVRWLLLVEIAQSVGPDDPWRAPSELFEEALTATGISDLVDLETGAGAYAGSTLDRWRSIGALQRLVHRFHGDTMVVAPPMRDVVAGALAPGPWRTAVEALLADERAAAVPGLQPRAAEAMVEQTRMIVHEVRNALVPVRVHLDAILSPDDDVPLEPTIAKARKGVVRVLEFVEQMLETSEIVSDATDHDAARLVLDAIGRLDGGDRVQLVEPPAGLRVRGQRRQLVIALSNVIDNALQAAPAPKAVRVALSARDGHVRIEVDDEGTGVPAADRTRIFDQGFTTRPGGSGFGLAYVKRTVEAVGGGKVWCEDSDLGGARLVIELPSDTSR